MTKFKKLDQIYKKIPDVDCQGHCHQSCTLIPAAKIEIKRARGRMGGKNPFNPVHALQSLQDNKIPSCAALKEGRCSIYTARPAICRLYGVAEGIECGFGCQPKKKLSNQEAYAIIREIEAL